MPDERIRVLRIFSRLNVGGPSIHVVLLSEKLDPERYQTTLVVGREGEREGSFHALAEEKKVRPVIISTLGRAVRPIQDLRSFFSLCRLMARSRPHIVHTHTAKAGALGRAAAFVTGVPLVIHTFHGSVFSGYFGATGTRVYRFIEKALSRITDAVVAISPAVAREIGAEGLSPRYGIHMIPLGLELDRFLRTRPRGALRARLGLEAETKLVGCVGRLAPIKDIPTLVAAFGHLENAHLVLVGDGPERPRLEALARESALASRVHFAGFLAGLENVYPDLDLVVNCSRNEGTPVALIEAMAARVPVVATAVGGTPDLLRGGDLGTLVPPKDPGALAHAISKILAEPTESASRAERARESVLETHRADRLVADIESFYGTLLERKGLTSGHLSPLET